MKPKPTSTDSTHLSVWPDLPKNLPDLWLEAHVQHPVGLVQHDVRAPLEVHLPHLEDVDEPARGGDADLCPSLKISDLAALRRSPKQTGRLELTRACKLGSLFLDLLGELSAMEYNVSKCTCENLHFKPCG